MASRVASLKIGPVTYKAGEYGPFTWPQTLGLEAPRVSVRMAPDDAAALLGGPREIKVVMQDANGVTKTIERVYVVGEEQSPDKLVRTVILTDVRFYLPFGWVRASYNLIVGTGTYRQLTNDAQATNAPPPRIQNFQYVPSSLKDGSPWNAADIAKDVLRLATTGHGFPAITVRDLSRPRTSFIPQNAKVDAMGDVAIGQTLGALGGLDIRVADDGAIEIVDAYLGAEKKALDPIVADYSLERKGVLRWISMSNVAPDGARVLVTRRIEVRADSYEGAPGAGGNLSAVGDDVTWGTDNTPTMINVGKVTDQRTPSGYVLGSLIPFSVLLEEIAAFNDAPAGAFSGWVPLTRQKLTGGPGGNTSASPMLSNILEQTFVADNGTGVGIDILWAARITEIRNSFRLRYKLNPVFARNCMPGSIQATRVGLLDAITGTRQPATVFMDYIQRPDEPGFSSTDAFGWAVNNVPGTPSGGIFPSGTKAYTESPGPYNVAPFKTTGASPAPFLTKCEDPSLGVFFFSPAAEDTSKIRHAAQNLPGLLWRFPTGDGGGLARGLGVATWGAMQRLLTHRVALIFSAIPVGGGGALQSYKVEVSEALARLGAPSDAVTPRAPRRELRIREGVAMALIPWDDDQRAALLAPFNVAATAGVIGPSDGLVPVNDVQLRDLAVSTYANWLATLLDHYEGSALVGFKPKVMPVGALRQVAHTFSEDGCFTTLHCDGVVPVASPEDSISQSSRNILFGGLGANY